MLFLQVQAISAVCPEHFKDAAAPQLLLWRLLPALLSPSLCLLLLKTQSGFLSWYKGMIREACCIKAKVLFSQPNTWKNNCAFVCANREQLFVSNSADCSCSRHAAYQRVLRVPCMNLPAPAIPLLALHDCFYPIWDLNELQFSIFVFDHVSKLIHSFKVLYSLSVILF